MLKVFTDCSGIEAPIQALLRLKVKFKHVASSDIDKYCKKVSEAIYNPGIFYDDLMARDNSKAPYSDIYIAGFPCQAFSIAGNRLGFDDIRGTIFFGCANYIRKKQPPIFILENVKGILSHDGGKTIKTITELLSGNGGTINGQMTFPYYDDGLGYHIYTGVLNTKEHGVPQSRPRWFCVGFKESRDYRFPVPFPLKLRLKDLLEPKVDEKYYLSDKAIRSLSRYTDDLDTQDEPFGLRWSNNKDGMKKDSISRCLVASTGNGGHRKEQIIVEPHIVAMRGRNPDNPSSRKTGDPTEQRLEANTQGTSNALTSVQKDNLVVEPEIITHNLQPRSSKLNKGGTGPLSKDDGTAYCLDQKNTQAIELKQIYSLKEGNPQGYRVYDINGCSITQAAEGGGFGAKTGLYSQYSRIRRLTPLECLRLQDFPDTFHAELVKMGISDNQIYRMAGNSMSVNVLVRILQNILDS